MAMGHTLDALRSRNSASLGPGASMWSAKRLDAGRRVVGLVVGKTTERPRLSWVVDYSYRVEEFIEDRYNYSLQPLN